MAVCWFEVKVVLIELSYFMEQTNMVLFFAFGNKDLEIKICKERNLIVFSPIKKQHWLKLPIRL